MEDETDAVPVRKIRADWLAEFEAAARRSLEQRWKYAFIKTYKPVMDDARSARSTRWKTTGNGAKKIFLNGWVITVFEYRQAEEVRDAFAANGVRYLFIGKSGAILLGYPDTTQDADVYVEKSVENGLAIVAALLVLGFEITEDEKQQIQRGKDFVQLKNGPFDLDLVFAPDGIERFADAWSRRVDIEGFHVCSIDDIIASKRAANRSKDRESLERLEGFRDFIRAKK